MGMALNARTRVISVQNAAAAGSVNQNTTALDMSQNGGYRGVRFIAHIGTLTASQVTKMKLQDSTDNGNWSDVTGSETAAMADGDSNKMLVCDCYRPKNRYLRAVIERGTANAVIDSVVAELYDPIVEPTTQDTTVSASTTVVSA